MKRASKGRVRVQPLHLERKTVAGSLLTLAAMGGAAALNGVNGSGLIPQLPAWSQSLVILLVPPVAQFLTQYVTRHTERTDLYGAE